MYKELLELEALLDLAKQRVTEARQQELRRGTMYMEKKVDTNIGSQMSEEAKKIVIHYMEQLIRNIIGLLQPLDKKDELYVKNVPHFLLQSQHDEGILRGLDDYKMYIKDGASRKVLHGDDENDFDSCYEETYISEIFCVITSELADRIGSYLEKCIKEVQNS